jgi:hypothetical protein
VLLHFGAADVLPLKSQKRHAQSSQRSSRMETNKWPAQIIKLPKMYYTDVYTIFPK